jgi:hypothetical protein
VRRDMLVLSLRSGVPFTDLSGSQWCGADVATLELLLDLRDEARRGDR